VRRWARAGAIPARRTDADDAHQGAPGLPGEAPADRSRTCQNARRRHRTAVTVASPTAVIAATAPDTQDAPAEGVSQLPPRQGVQAIPAGSSPLAVEALPLE